MAAVVAPDILRVALEVLNVQPDVVARDEPLHLRRREEPQPPDRNDGQKPPQKRVCLLLQLPAARGKRKGERKKKEIEVVIITTCALP